MKRFILLAALFLSGCSKLSVYTDYVSDETLASYYIGTPDPRLNNPTIGQRLIISWSIPKRWIEYENLHLEIWVRFRNHMEDAFSMPINKPTGTYIYSVLDEDFCETNGILAYKIDMIGGGEILEEWRHQLWVELISFSKEIE